MSDIANQEVLWRSILPSDVKSLVGQPLILKSTAFNDRTKKPSVDRAEIRQDPLLSKKDPACGVVALTAEEVRSIAAIQRPFKDGTIQRHAINVIADPEPHNPSHALIVADPQIDHDGTFKRLKEALARIASAKGWVVAVNSNSNV